MTAPRIPTRARRALIPAAGALLAAGALAGGALAQSSGLLAAPVGMLVCTVSSGSASYGQATCLFNALGGGAPETFAATFRRGEGDSAPGGQLIWTVLATGAGAVGSLGTGALAGSYAGGDGTSDASGAGANGLFGGRTRGIIIQPVGADPTRGVGSSATVTSLDLRAAS